MTRLLIRAKAPVPGATKIRLRLPPKKAADLQAALVRDMIGKARALCLGVVTVAGTPPEGLSLIQPLLPDEGVRLMVQCGRDLGERMFAAAARLFEEGSEPVLILGTDAPTLQPDSIRRAAHALDRRYDAAIIGSTDGGYVLLGLRGPHEGLFHGVRWSTKAVYRETIERVCKLGLSVYEGEPQYDVDTPEDLARLEKELAASPDWAPRTAKVLRHL